MNLYLATWPEGWGHSKNPKSLFASGTVQWESMRQLHSYDANRKNLKLRILLSYWYYKDVDLDALFAKYFTEPYPDVFADSGAYSAMTQGVYISIREYAGWIRRYKHLFSTYANLDVIMDAEATWRNQQELEGMGLNPLPAFHVQEDFEWLERYVDTYPYIALGVAGMQQRKPGLMSWLVRCFKIAGERSVFHGFALTSWQVMRSFPWYSVDSSSWGQGFRYGQVPIFNTRMGKFIKLNLGDYAAWRKHAALVKSLGFDALDFADRSRNDRAKIAGISALSYMLAEQWLRQVHGEIRIPIRENAGGEGLKAYIVAGPSHPDTPMGGNMSLTALALAGFGDPGFRLHLADARPSDGGDLGAADSGLKSYIKQGEEKEDGRQD